MNKPEKEVRDYYDETERAILKKLEQHYKEALTDINKRIAQLMGLQNPDLPQVINHREYQQRLKSWIEAALDRLHAKEYDSIAEYLDDSYKNGFVGTMYTLYHQDVPFLLPIDESVAIKAVTLNSHLSEGLYASLGFDLKELRKTVQSEITRGIATGLMYKDIARNISNASGVPMRRAKTIARTEAGRIQEQATMDAANKAKEKGADLVKQWSAIRDGRTRENHRYLHGQVRELDEYFEVEGHEALEPHGFGVASEDCNCRCTTLIRQRSKMNEAEYKRLQEVARDHGLLVKDSKEYGHKVSKNFADFKKNYLNAMRTVEPK